MIPSRPWAADAKCAVQQMDPALFDTQGRGLKGWTAHREAKDLCSGCPVMRQCARDALLLGDSGVVRAGVPLPESLSRREGIARLMYVAEYGKVPGAHALHDFMETHEVPIYSIYGIDYRIA